MSDDNLYCLLKSWDEETKTAEFYIRDKSIKIKLEHVDNALVICDMMKLIEDATNEFRDHLEKGNI